MTNDKTVTISRELAERLANVLYMHDAENTDAATELDALIAAPVVECQEPVVVKRYDRDSVSGHSDVEITLLGVGTHYDHRPNLAEALARLVLRVARLHKLEAPSLADTSPPAPVAVDERAEFESWVNNEWFSTPIGYSNGRQRYIDDSVQRAWVGWQARACLDKVKELNQ